MDVLNKFFKYASLLLVAVVLISCTKDNGVVKKDLVISVDKKFVQTFGGDYITLSVELKGEPLTDGVVFYDENDDVIPVEDFKYMTEVPGEHQIIANYGTYDSAPVTITAIAVAIPETPEDPQPERTDFEHKVLLTQFTTTGCTYCPQMKLLLKDALTDAYYKKVVKVDCHSSTVNRNDPVYVDLQDFQDKCSGVLPSVNYCLSRTSQGYLKGMSYTVLQEQIDSWYNFQDPSAVGISVNSVATEDQIVAKVTVKAAVTGKYRVGLMLLEDGIVATSSQTQQGSGAEDWMDTHNSALRYLDSKCFIGGGTEYFGHSLDEIPAGETAEYVFILDLPSIWDDGMLAAEQNGSTWADRWVMENLHLAVFVTTLGNLSGEQIYYVSNVVDCPVNGVTPFQYK